MGKYYKRLYTERDFHKPSRTALGGRWKQWNHRNYGIETDVPDSDRAYKRGLSLAQSKSSRVSIFFEISSSWYFAKSKKKSEVIKLLEKLLHEQLNRVNSLEICILCFVFFLLQLAYSNISSSKFKLILVKSMELSRIYCYAPCWWWQYCVLELKWQKFNIAANISHIISSNHDILCYFYSRTCVTLHRYFFVLLNVRRKKKLLY